MNNYSALNYNTYPNTFAKICNKQYKKESQDM